MCVEGALYCVTFAWMQVTTECGVRVGGFKGTALVVLLFTFLILRILSRAEVQKNNFSRVYAYSVASILFVHFFINIGMSIGLVPTIGIPLPFISYGGSSLLAFTILIAIYLNLDANRLNEASF